MKYLLYGKEHLLYGERKPVVWLKEKETCCMVKEKDRKPVVWLLDLSYGQKHI